MRWVRSAKAIASRVDPGYFNRGDRPARLRRILILGSCAVAVLWWGLRASMGDRTIYSPGPVGSPHAMFENDCAKCHAPDGKGGFSQAISDAACLRCHDGAMHHPNQPTATLASTVGSTPHTFTFNCAGCHLEHRGRDVLMARDNGNCVRCHSDLKSNSQDGAPSIAPRVVAFGVETHPPFGRTLTATQKWSMAPQPLIDPTPMKFNHQVHMAGGKGYVKPIPPETENCTACHEPKAAPLGSLGARQYMRPVSYEQNCKECHGLSLPTGAPLSHGSMASVRRELGDLPGVHREWFNTLPPETRAKELTRETVGPPPLRKITKKTIGIDDWVREKSAAVGTGLGNLYAERGAQLPGYDKLQAALASTRPAGSAPPAANAPASSSVMELMLAADPLAKVSCVKCHEITGSPQAVYEQSLAAAARAPAAASPASPAPATLPASGIGVAMQLPPPTTPLATAHTGIGHLPRRWFENSRFDHGSHRLVNCLECHGAAKMSVATSDVLLPTLQSCVRCHHEPNSDDRGAGAACQTCHEFHDRSRERPAGTHSLLAPLGTAEQPSLLKP